jgi:hypothetical protein
MQRRKVSTLCREIALPASRPQQGCRDPAGGRLPAHIDHSALRSAGLRLRGGSDRRRCHSCTRLVPCKTCCSLYHECTCTPRWPLHSAGTNCCATMGCDHAETCEAHAGGASSSFVQLSTVAGARRGGELAKRLVDALVRSSVHFVLDALWQDAAQHALKVLRASRFRSVYIKRIDRSHDPT